MNTSQSTKLVVLFVALTVAGIAMAGIGLWIGAGRESAILIAVGASLFAGALACFLVSWARQLEIKRSAVLFGALTIAGILMAILGVSVQQVGAGAVLVAFGAALFTAALTFFLLRPMEMQDA